MSLYPSEVKVEEQTEWAEFWLVSGGSSLVEGKESRKKNDWIKSTETKLKLKLKLKLKTKTKTGTRIVYGCGFDINVHLLKYICKEK